MSHLITFPDPDTIFYEKPSLKKYFRYLTFFGPGAIIASMIIGQGQLIIGPQIGAWAGFALLWLVTLNIATYIIAYVGGRFTLLSGLSIMDVFAEKSKDPAKKLLQRIEPKLQKITSSYTIDRSRVVRMVGPRLYQIVLDIHISKL